MAFKRKPFWIADYSLENYRKFYMLNSYYRLFNPILYLRMPDNMQLTSIGFPRINPFWKPSN